MVNLVDAIWTPISLITFFLMMFGLGASLRFESFKDRLKKPKGIVIGFFSQFLFMPFFCWILTLIFPLKDSFAVGLITIGCCPGGALSNVLCYIFQADVALSIAMTTCSSIAAIGLLPFNTFLYISVLGDNDVEFAWLGMITSTLVVILGTCGGLYLSARHRQHTWVAEKIGNVCMVILTLGTLIVQNVSGDSGGSKYPPLVIFVALLPTLTGTAVGIGLATATKLKKSSRIAVGVETAVQNQLLAISIISLTLKGDERNEAYAVPIVYAFWSFLWNVALCGFLFKRGWTEAPPGMSVLQAYKEYRNNRKRGFIGTIARKKSAELAGSEEAIKEAEALEAELAGVKVAPTPVGGTEKNMAQGLASDSALDSPHTTEEPATTDTTDNAEGAADADADPDDPFRD